MVGRWIRFGLSGLLLAWALSQPVQASEDFSKWFDAFKTSATDTALHDFLYNMPKGGDLHQHLSGSIFSEWWWQLALGKPAQGEIFFTRLRMGNCLPIDAAAAAGNAQLLFQTISQYRFDRLSACQQTMFTALAQLNPAEQQAWMNSVRLDEPSEGRDEFFETHWQRLGDVIANPWIMAEALALHIKAFADEGLVYLEPQVTLLGYRDKAGLALTPSEVATIFRARLNQPDLVKTGVTLRFQQSILRFLPDAETELAHAYQIVSDEPEWIAVNMVGREDDDRGHPLRFLETIRGLRQQYPDVRLSIHAGEVDEPNHHVRDTLLLGADRIGHGLNLISDRQTLIQMRHGPYLVEINLISNLLLEYVPEFSAHPFPEYLRLGVPVALSTDDRGMWDSTMTDEYFVAVKSFNLSWSELRRLTENSIQYSFLAPGPKAVLLVSLDQRFTAFEKRMQDQDPRQVAALKISPKRGFVCRKYNLCSRQ
ncbi:MAG: hypothetical protein QNL18_02235 [Pseudomonadales bacterium]|jgi:adenosine deaminase CECR1|tara:strand:+ start:938 stop:2380 length:1443 start_codon:yes stop_codon:yes gene_type:complete